MSNPCNSRTISKALILQTGGLSHFKRTIQLIRNQYPEATLEGLVQEGPDQSTHLDVLGEEFPFAVFKSMPSTKDRSAWKQKKADIWCVIPFEDRFGVLYWTHRWAVLNSQCAGIISCDKTGQLRTFGRIGWCLDTVVACGPLRVLWYVRTVLTRLWLFIRRRVSIAGLFILSVVALAFRGLQVLGLHPIQRLWTRRLPTGKKRLALFIPSLGLGGAQRQLAIFLDFVDREQWEVEVITVDALDKFFEPLIERKGIPVVRLDPHWQLYEVGLIIQLIRHLYHRPCHVLHGWLHFAAALGAVTGRLVGIQTVVGSFRSEAPGRFPWFYPPWQRAIDILTAPLHSRVIANSNAVLKESQQWAFIPTRKLVTIYNGVPNNSLPVARHDQASRLRAELCLSEHMPIVGIVGRLSPEKDHATFLHAAREIHRNRPDARFLVVGNGPLHSWIEAEIEHLGLTGIIQLLGGRNDTEMLLNLMDVLVLTSTSEGLPNVLLEAGAAGVAVVTTAAGGAVEVVEDGKTGFVVPCRDAGAVADRVVTLIENPSLRASFSAAARERMRTVFAADRVAWSIQACYAESC